jgi:hypothetical protein
MTDIANASKMVQTSEPAIPKKQQIVVVLGMHRSGTSLLTNLLHVLGVDLGEELLAGDAYNEMGHWENEGIYRTQNDLMNEIAKDWGDYGLAYPFAIDWTRLPDLQVYKDKLISIVTKEIASAKGLWGFKDPRTCRLLPLWKQIFAELQLQPLYVLAVRDPAVVVDSLLKRDGLDPLHSELIWLLHTLDAVRDVGSELRVVVDYDRWFTAPREQSQALARALDLAWPADDAEWMDRFSTTIRSDLRRSKARRPCSLPFVAKTYETLKQIAATGLAPDKLALRELQSASDDLAAALELSTGTGRIALAVGNAELSAGNLEAALAAYSRAARLQPRLASAHSRRASALRSLGRLPEAFESAKQALALDPTDALAIKLVDAIQIKSASTFECLNHIGQARVTKGTAKQMAVWEITFQEKTSKSMFLQPPAEVVFEIPTGAAGRLITAVMLHPDVWEKTESGGCEFHLRVDGRVALVMSLDPLNLPFDRRWYEINLDIPESSRGRHQIHFETRSVGRSNDFRWALWRAPEFVWQASVNTSQAELSTAASTQPQPTNL